MYESLRMICDVQQGCSCQPVCTTHTRRYILCTLRPEEKTDNGILHESSLLPSSKLHLESGCLLRLLCNARLACLPPPFQRLQVSTTPHTNLERFQLLSLAVFAVCSLPPLASLPLFAFTPSTTHFRNESEPRPTPLASYIARLAHQAPVACPPH